MELPKGGDVQSDNACACFVRVGCCRFGSMLFFVLGVILGAKFATELLFGRPCSPNRHHPGRFNFKSNLGSIPGGLEGAAGESQWGGGTTANDRFGGPGGDQEGVASTRISQPCAPCKQGLAEIYVYIYIYMAVSE